MTIETLLSRLQKVKRTSANSWLACCCAHEDRNPSLSIRDNGDGRILLNCFAGCSAENILDSIGLTWDDVMPERAIEHHIKPQKVRVYATDALRAISFEAQIVCVAAFDLSKGKALDSDSLNRLKLAMERINSALEACGGD